jgi:hypothetical protein
MACSSTAESGDPKDGPDERQFNHFFFEGDQGKLIEVSITDCKNCRQTNALRVRVWPPKFEDMCTCCSIVKELKDAHTHPNHAKATAMFDRYLTLKAIKDRYVSKQASKCNFEKPILLCMRRILFLRDLLRDLPTADTCEILERWELACSLS